MPELMRIQEPSTEAVAPLPRPKPSPKARTVANAFSNPRDFLQNRFVYLVVSPRARGLSIGINTNPDKKCNFDCSYCEVNRAVPAESTVLDLALMAEELRNTLALSQSGGLARLPMYAQLPDELLQLRHVALSGDGEPTLSGLFPEALQTVVHVRATSPWGFFKIVVITNGTGLDRPPVQEALDLLTLSDEVWVKLDAGTQSYMDQINRADCSLEHILDNILLTARQRPIVIQSLFTALNGAEVPRPEVEAYAGRLRQLAVNGAQIDRVQIYSATRPAPQSACTHLSLKSLASISQIVRSMSGLKVEVF
jgi:wyosine [tRNA(Phe)-imidazoG37] synthetase (radical SAM superfamily)